MIAAKPTTNGRGPTTAQIPVGGEIALTSPKRLARIAGLLYLLVGIFGGFAQVFLALILYRLLKHVNKDAARAMVVLVAIGASITVLNAVFEFEGLRVATGAVNLGGFGAAGSNALALLLVDAQHYGLLIASIFFGLWLVPLGYLAYRSGWFPRALGVTLIVGGACYLVDMLAAFLLPDIGKATHGYVNIASAIAEIWMVVYLLVIGVKMSTPGERLVHKEGRS